MAEAANPEMVSVPLVGLTANVVSPPWSLYSVSPLNDALRMFASSGSSDRSNIQNAPRLLPLSP